MKTDWEILETISMCSFEHHPQLQIRTHLEAESGDNWFQIVDPTLDAEFNSGRKWRLSRHMCRSEIVATVFAAYQAWVEHEARESFTYREQAIYGPHFDVDMLAQFASLHGNHQYRTAG